MRFAGLSASPVVTDPLGDYDLALLRASFPELARPFKQHYVIDLAEAPSKFVSRHHQRNARSALGRVPGRTVF